MPHLYLYGAGDWHYGNFRREDCLHINGQKAEIVATVILRQETRTWDR